MTVDPFATPVDPGLVHFGPWDLEADDANEAVADALRARRPGRWSTVTTLTLGGRRSVEVEYVPQDHRSGYGYLTATRVSAVHLQPAIETFRRQDEDEDAAVVRIAAGIADWLRGEL